jgi:hypothetical protein
MPWKKSSKTAPSMMNCRCGRLSAASTIHRKRRVVDAAPQHEPHAIGKAAASVQQDENHQHNA